MYFLYKIINLSNNMIYIGCTKNINQRIKNHLYNLCKNNHENKILQKDWNFFGYDYFDFEIIESFTENIGLQKEIETIKMYNSMYPNGYNLTKGGVGVNGYIQDNNQRKNQSIKMQGKNNSRYNKKMNMSQYKGVYIHKKKNENYIYYNAKMTINKKSVWIGEFKKEKDAAIAYDDYCWLVYKDLNHLNFPERKINV